MFGDTVYAGIDPSAARKAFAYAALDGQLAVLALADAELEEVISYIEGQESAVVAVNAPARVNRGLVKARIRSAMFPPHQIRGAEMRVAEYELRECGIAVAGTAARVELCPAWMQLGFALFARLNELGFEQAPESTSARRLLETHPAACFHALLGQNPFPKPTLEGRLQRQLILFERGVRLRDPMDFFEEVTRHKLIKGALPMDVVYAPEHLDALAAAYTAWLWAHDRGKTTAIGDELEGQIVLPMAPRGQGNQSAGAVR